MNAYIVLQSLDIEDVIEADAQQLVVALDEHETIFAVSVQLLCSAEPRECLVARLEEILIGDGLQQIVECTDLIAFDGVLREGCGEDNLGVLGQDLGKLDALEFWHLDVKEQ